jgi:hypothetical protein
MPAITFEPARDGRKVSAFRPCVRREWHSPPNFHPNNWVRARPVGSRRVSLPKSREVDEP